MTSDVDAVGQWGDDQLVAVMDPVRRVAAARTEDPHVIEDVVQETLARVLAARDRLAGSSLLPYAVVTARNLVAEHGRDIARHRRHAHRVVDLREPDRPDELVLRRQEELALAEALDALPEQDRLLLVAHEVGGDDTSTLAESGGTTAGGVAARLARTRARLRVDYVLALRRSDLPTPRCRPVLLALSSGDRRRQQALQAGRHLLACDACASVSEPLLERQRALAGMLPWLAAPAAAWSALRLAARQHPATTAVGATGAVAVGAVIAVAATHSNQRPAPVPVGHRPTAPAEANVSVGGEPIPDAGPSGRLTRYVGERVRATRALVVAVPADEGFWVQASPRTRLWVQLKMSGESAQRVRAGQRVSFTGVMVRNRVHFAESVGVTPAEGAARLDEAGAHVEAPASSLRGAGG